MKLRIVYFLGALALSSCGATPGPDKAMSGTILGAGWGAGAGAVIGNQTDSLGPGAAVGAGVGAVSGMISGIGLDLEESSQLKARRDIRALRTQVQLNEAELFDLRDELNSRGRLLAHTPSGTTIYFDPKLASLRTGSAKELENLAEAIKHDYHIRRIEIFGHSDDSGSKDENEQLSLSRAKSVQGFLAAHGVSLDQITISAVSSLEPVASNTRESGRQLNRRVEIVLVR